MAERCDIGLSFDSDEAGIVMDDIRNRIQEVRKVKFADIANHPRNPKKHGEAQRKAFRGSIAELGFVSVPLVYASERNQGKLTWADGHLRGSEVNGYTGDVAILDIDDAEADKLLLYADPIAAMAEYESQQLDGLLRDVQTSDESLAKMLADLAQQSGLYPDGAPDVQFKEYDESVADDVGMITCPHCGGEFPK